MPGFPLPTVFTSYASALDNSAPCTLRQTPPQTEGDREIPCHIVWDGTTNAQLVNVQGRGSAPISRIAGLYVNNVYSTTDAQFLFQDTQFILTVPAGESGYYPVPATAATLQFFVQAPGAQSTDEIYFTIFNFAPQPCAFNKPTFNSIASLASVNMAAGTTPLIAAGTNGLIQAMHLVLNGATNAGSGTFGILDGAGNPLLSAGINTPAAGSPPAELAGVEGVNLRFINGLNLVLTGAGFPAGTVNVNVYHREVNTP